MTLMRYLQNLTKSPITAQAVDKSVNTVDKPLTQKQKMFIDFCARSGLYVDPDGTPRRMSYEDFAISIQVTRQTLYDWKKRIPQFRDLVADESDQIFKEYVAHANKALSLQAMKGNIGALKLMYTQAERLKAPPKETKEIQITGLADVVSELTTD